MKTKSQISMDFNRVLELTQKLDELAGTLKNEFDSKTEDILGTLRSAWDGDNASEFTGRIGELKEKTIPSAAEVKRLSAGIKSNAEMVYKAEMEAIRIALTRGSSN